MAYRNLVVINGEVRELKDIPKDERQRMADEWNRRAAEAVNYEEKTA